MLLRFRKGTMEKSKELIFATYKEMLKKAVLSGVISWAVFDSSLIEIRKSLGLPICKHCWCHLLT